MALTKTVRLVLAGGGSGGHLFPLIAVAEQIEKLSVEFGVSPEITYLGPKGEYGAMLEAYGVRQRPLISGKIRRYRSAANFFDIPKFFFGMLQALWRLFWIMPDAVFSKGGVGAFPVVFAAWLYRVPVVIHESDAVPGLTNGLSARFAKRIAVSFESARSYFPARKTAWTGSPLRRELFGGEPDQEFAKETLRFKKNEPLILVLGGSQGSERMNKFVLENLPELLRIAQVLHQTGAANFEEVKKLSRTAAGEAKPFAETERYQVVPFIGKDLKTAYAAADLVVSRAGSGAIFEIAAFGKPAILIPLPESANNHQRVNAYEFARTGAAVVIEEGNLLPGIFLRQMEDLFEKPGLLEKMKEASRKFFKPGAAEVIAREIYKLIT